MCDNIDSDLDNKTFDFAEREIAEFLTKSETKAIKLLADEDETECFLQKVEKKLKSVPIAGTALAYIPLMVSMVRMYIKKEYTEIPSGSIISAVIALLYFVLPVDIIPDVIPGIGYIDDAFIVATCLVLIRTDLIDYKEWREKNNMVVENLPDYNQITKGIEHFSNYTKDFLIDKKNAE